jgi:hypothetical protein
MAELDEIDPLLGDSTRTQKPKDALRLLAQVTEPASLRSRKL